MSPAAAMATGLLDASTGVEGGQDGFLMREREPSVLGEKYWRTNDASRDSSIII